MNIPDLLQQLNSTDENHQIEAKRGSDVEKSFYETVCAFANEPDLGGGYILLGVSKDETSLFPHYTVVGVENPDVLSQKIATQCRDLFNVQIRPKVETYTIKGKIVIGVYVPELFPAEKPAYLKKVGLPKGAYRRIGSTDQTCTEDDLLIFYGSKKAETYDTTPILSADMSDIDTEAIEHYRQLRKNVNASAEELLWSDEKLLQAFSCVIKVNGEWHPTIAGILLFGTRMSFRRLFPMMRVDYIRVPGKEWIENATDRFSTIDMRGPLLQLVSRIQNAVADDLPKGFVLPEGAVQAQNPGLSTRVLREVIVNALMHRSYKVHEPIQIIRYSNRLEIRNPGYSLKAEERLGEPGSENRNPNIAAVFHETNIAETKGSGIGTMRRLMKESNFAPPTFDSNRRDNLFTAKLLLQHFLDPKDLLWLSNFDGFNLNENQKNALIFVRETGQINNPAYRQLSATDTLSASKDLRSMCASEILEMKGKSTATVYEPGPAYQEVVFRQAIGLPVVQIGTSPMQERIPPMQEGIPPMQERIPPMQDGVSPILGIVESEAVFTGTFTELSDEIIQKLDSIRNSKRSNSSDMKSVIAALCSVRELTSKQLGSILHRGSPMLVQQYLTPMVASGSLEYTVPSSVFDRKQAYRTVK